MVFGQRVGLIYKLWPYSTRFEITIFYRIQHFNENVFVTRGEFFTFKTGYTLRYVDFRYLSVTCIALTLRQIKMHKAAY